MFGRKSSASRDAKSVALSPTGQQSDLATNAQITRQEFKGLDVIQGEGVVLVGKGTHLIGDITNCSVVDIQGVLEGNVSADVVIVRDGGGFKGTFQAEHAEILGVVEGQVTVHGLLDVRSTGHITANVAYEQLAVAIGAHIAGQLETPTTVDAVSSAMGDMTSGAKGPNDTHGSSSDYINGSMSQTSDVKTNGSLPAMS